MGIKKTDKISQSGLTSCSDWDKNGFMSVDLHLILLIMSLFLWASSGVYWLVIHFQLKKSLAGEKHLTASLLTSFLALVFAVVAYSRVDNDYQFLFTVLCILFLFVSFRYSLTPGD